MIVGQCRYFGSKFFNFDFNSLFSSLSSKLFSGIAAFSTKSGQVQAGCEAADCKAVDCEAVGCEADGCEEEPEATGCEEKVDAFEAFLLLEIEMDPEDLVEFTWFPSNLSVDFALAYSNEPGIASRCFLALLARFWVFLR